MTTKTTTTPDNNNTKNTTKPQKRSRRSPSQKARSKEFFQKKMNERKAAQAAKKEKTTNLNAKFLFYVLVTSCHHTGLNPSGRTSLALAKGPFSPASISRTARDYTLRLNTLLLGLILMAARWKCGAAIPHVV